MRFSVTMNFEGLSYQEDEVSLFLQIVPAAQKHIESDSSLYFSILSTSATLVFLLTVCSIYKEGNTAAKRKRLMYTKKCQDNREPNNGKQKKHMNPAHKDPSESISPHIHLWTYPGQGCRVSLYLIKNWKTYKNQPEKELKYLKMQETQLEMRRKQQECTFLYLTALIFLSQYNPSSCLKLT